MKLPMVFVQKRTFSFFFSAIRIGNFNGCSIRNPEQFMISAVYEPYFLFPFRCSHLTFPRFKKRGSTSRLFQIFFNLFHRSIIPAYYFLFFFLRVITKITHPALIPSERNARSRFVSSPVFGISVTFLDSSGVFLFWISFRTSMTGVLSSL